MIDGRTARRVIDGLLAGEFLVLVVSPVNYGPVHEWAGIAAFVLAAAHIVLNARRIGTLLARHDAMACVNLAIELALLCGIIALAVSPLVLSEHAFAWLPAIPGAAWARLVHLAASYWTFALAFLHGGMHLQEAFGKLSRNTAAKWAGRVLFALGLCYGAYSFATLGIWSCMTLQARFAFIDPNAGGAALQYAAIAAALAGCGHYLACGLLWRRQRTTAKV